MCLRETPRRLARRGVFWLALLLALGAGAAELKPAGGTRALPLSLKTLDGTTHDLAQLRGKVVLVNFWATWCEPCRDEMPSIERLKEKFAGQPFEVLAVNVDEPEARVRAFLEKTPLQLNVVLDPGKAVTKNWNARILPASFVIGRDGRLHYSAVGEMDWSLERNEKIIDTLMRRR
jgi:thiol-disulfide isomerase/thioredoxin